VNRFVAFTLGMGTVCVMRIWTGGTVEEAGRRLAWLRPLLLLLGVLAVAGCSSTPKVDWNARIGVYTYDQAVMELGPPDRTTQLSDGSRVADWFERRGSTMSVGVGTGFYGPRSGVAVGQTVRPGGAGVFLRLTFDAAGVLVRWERVRR
jgi:hypothetical protein